MKCIWILLLCVLLCLPVSVTGQTDLSFRKPDIENFTEAIYSVSEFHKFAHALQMSVLELSDYPVIFPVRYPQITSGYGNRIHPVYSVRKFHRGVDFSAVTGIPVYATGNGVVRRKGYDAGYGYFIEIQHRGGFCSFYAHLSKTLVNTGDSVSMGKHIAFVGNSGRSTGSHLHYEIRKNQRFLNPLGWCFFLIDWLESCKMNDAQSHPGNA